MKTAKVTTWIICAAAVALLGSFATTSAAGPLVSLEYKITGVQLTVSPSALSVPKGVAGSVMAQVNTGGDEVSLFALTNGAYVEAFLRGPNIEAHQVVGAPNAPLLLPPLNVSGDYQLANIRLVDATTGATRLEGDPSAIPVHVFEEALVSKVTSRPLTSEEIKEKGIFIDENNFRAVEFEVGFVLDGKTIPVKFPVVAPTFTQSTEIIPAAELEAKLARAAEINQQIASEASLPGELEGSNLNIQVQGINFQRVDSNDQDLALTIPPIPALMVIPGNIGYLNQFFSVQIFTENGAPAGSGLSVLNVQAELVLPPGPDKAPALSYEAPGDDPVRFARLGPDKIVQPIQKIAHVGADGKAATADDVERLFPGESGQAEFLVEGLQEGLHVLDLALTADLDGLAAGIVKVKGKAAGSVLVRNPKFSLAFTHPRTVRSGEPYEASATVLNTSPVYANQVRITLGSASLSGGVLESEETVELGDIPPGQSRTATWRVRAQRTGAISFSNLTTGDDSVIGRFRLKMGIDERGVALSPDTIGMPDYVNSLPTNIIKAATRVLGQALSVSTAPQLPAGIIKVTKSAITARVLDLAEAGQRIKYGDSKARVLADLLLDWQGNRIFNAGFDQILRETDAGLEWREAMVAELQAADTLNASARLTAAAPDFAGRNESFVVFAGAEGAVEAALSNSIVTGTNSASPRSLVYFGDRGSWLVTPGNVPAAVTLRITNEVAEATATALFVQTNGVAQQYQWIIANPTANACYLFDYSAPTELRVDVDCDGVVDATLAAVVTTVNERPPDVIAVLQDLTVKSGRPPVPCIGGFGDNYGTVIAVMFSKPMAQNQVNVGSAYRLDNGNVANSVQIQPGARVALLNMKAPLSAIRPRTMTVSGISDARGNALVVVPKPVQGNVRNGVAIRGRVVRADGSFAANNPVTLTMYDADNSGFECNPYVVRVAQVISDENGFFEFDYVMAGVPYSVSATDVAGLPDEVKEAILESASADALNRAKLEQLANSPSVKGSLLAAFAVAALPEAIAKAEGLDRALLRDLAPSGSAREGSEVIVALRFRGRGAVNGQVFSADGITPAVNVAVNLYPDPDSRELGRGIFSDENGRFAFYGVPLGVFSVQAQASSGQFRTVSDIITTAGDVKSVSIVLSTNAVTLVSVGGRVMEADNVTPHQGAHVLVGKYIDGKFGSVVALATTDADGYWTASNFPSGIYDIAAISVDGKRKGERRDISTAGGGTFTTITLDGRATVFGRVETSTGAAVPNALVAGGEGIVRTDGNGLFTMPGVPIGVRSLSAGLERNPAAGIDFPRLGSASLSVVPGSDNFVVIRLNPAGRIIGRVLDVAGQPVPNIRVAVPQENGFMWVETDGNGNYRFENLGLGGYTLSAPAGPVANTDVGGLLSAIRSGSEEEVQAAITDAFAIFTGAADPYLNGEGQKFNPKTWGFTKATLQFDGQTVVADIHFLREGTVSGIVLNSQGVPIGARVRLTGIGPLANGMPSTIIRGEMNTDPALGTFSFVGSALEGDWGLQVASPFYPTILTTSGQIGPTPPDPTNVVMRFPPVSDVNGRLVGRVFMPDGSPGSSNINVKISFGNDYVIRTAGGGFFDTQIKLPAGPYSVEAEDPVSGFRGIAGVTVIAGVTNVCDVRLLGKGGLMVMVRQANGAPALNALVEISQAGFPGDRFSGPAADGTLTVQNLFESPYSISASYVAGPTTIYGRSAATVTRNQTTTAIVTLAPTANVRGQFVLRDLTPVGFAQVAIGNLGFAATDASGNFEIKGVPLGTYRLVTQDPVSGVGASATVTLSVEGKTVDVRLVEQARGEVHGAVISSYGSGFVPGASVRLTSHDGLTPSRSVTTGPDGRFSFPGTPAGGFSLDAEDPITKLTGHTSAVLPETASSFEVNVPLQSLARLEIRVQSPDGATPHTNASVRLKGPRQVQADVDGNGRVSFVDLPLGAYSITAQSLTPAESRSFGIASAALSAAGETNNATVRLNGVGRVIGRIFSSDGVTPVNSATVTLTTQASLFQGLSLTAISDGNGDYAFENIPFGEYRVAATDEALGDSQDGSIDGNSEVDVVNLALGPSGSVSGRLVRANGVTAVGNIDVLITFASQSGLPGRAFVRAAADGTFAFQNIPVGNLFIQADGPEFAGLIRSSAFLAVNGQNLALGDLAFDEEDPRVLAVFPLHTAAEVPTTTKVDLYFNEHLMASSLNTNGVFLRTGTNVVGANVNLLPDPTNGLLRLVRISPIAALESLKTYEVVVIDADRKDPFGNVTATGPTDLVGRPLVTPFVSRFSTADNAPPQLVSTFPTNGSIQIDPATVMRFTFNEPIAAGSVITLTGPDGTVAGAVNTALNGLALVFTPNQLLEANTTFTLSASNIRDLAGNAALNQPFTSTFVTVDTVGPQISSLSIVSDRRPVASSTIQVEAALAQAEPGASVRFLQEFTPIGAAVAPPYRFPVTLPSSGSTTIRAIAMDQFNNEGVAKELVITVVSNEPPTIAFARGNPPTGPVGNNQLFTLVLSGTDDVTVTNMNVRATGLFNFTTNFNSGAQRTIALTVPTDAPPGSSVEFRAGSIDSFGLTSAESVLGIQTTDTAAPVLVVVSPAADTLLNPDQNLRLEIASSDNGTNAHQLIVQIDSLSFTQALDVAAAPNVRGTNVFTIPLANAPTSPLPLTVTVRALDGSGNAAVTTRSFRLPDREPPRLVSVSPQNATANQSLWTERVVFQFTERLDTNLVDTNVVILTNEVATGLPYDLETSADGTFVFVRPTLPLRPATTYTNIILPGLEDVAGNALAASDGGAWPEGGAAFKFKTAAIGTVSPTNGAVVIASKDFNARVNFDSGLGADFIRFVLNTNPPVDVTVSGGATFATAVLRAPTNSTSGHIEISAHKNGFEPYAIGAIDVVIDSFIEIGPPPDGNQNRPPTIDDGASRRVEVVQNVGASFDFTMRDADHNLKSVVIEGGNVATFFNLGYSLSSLSQVDFARAPDVVENLTVINYPSTGGPLWNGGPVVYFAMRFQGTFTITNEGSYTFYISSDDGSALYVDGNLLVNNDGLHGMAEANAAITLSAGEHSLDARMFENGGSHGVIVHWAGPDFSKRLMEFQGIRAYWSDIGSMLFQTTNQIGLVRLPMSLFSANVGTNQLRIIAMDFDSNAATQAVEVVTLRDLDGDTIADRDDSDIDGDSLTNDAEIAQGTDPADADSDDDNIPDNLDARPLAPNQLPLASVNGTVALAFDGGNDFMEKRSPTVDLDVRDSSWTVSAWIRTTDTGTQEMLIAGRYECGWSNCSSPDGNALALWGLSLRSGLARFAVRATGDYLNVDGTTDLRDGQWHLVAGVLDRATSQIHVIVDGELQNSLSVAGLGSIRDAGSPFSIGRQYREIWGSPGEYFNGWIREVRVWSIARTAPELAAERTAPPATASAGLVGYWPLNEGSGATGTNLVADANHLTLGGSDATTRPQWVEFFDQTGTADRVLTLGGSDPEGDPILATITALPDAGALYQTEDGVTRGDRITAAPATVSNPQNKVIFAPPPGVNAPQFISYKVSDGFAFSGDARFAVWFVPNPTADFDGDGMPDVYEVKHNLNAELNDAAEDADRDALTNLAEFQRQTNPRDADTDHDGFFDGAEIAAGSDPFDRDSDGDRLLDGFDPQPTVVSPGLTFEGQNVVSLVEGDSTNLVVQVISTNGAIVLVDYADDAQAPPFSVIGGIQFTNTGTNFIASARIAINPLHDGAGEHDIKLHAASQTGESGEFTIHVSVAENIGLGVTRWKDPVNGAWSDASKWTAGVPTPEVVAVIDTPGTYEVNLNMGASAKGLVLNSANATVVLTANNTWTFPAEFRAGIFSFGNDRTLNVERTLINRGTINMITQNTHSYLGGAGVFQNSGNLVAFVGGSLFGGAAHIYAPTTITASGQFTVNANAQLELVTSPFIAGKTLIHPGGRMYLPNVNPALTLTYMEGALTEGNGTLELRGSDQLHVRGGHHNIHRLELFDVTSVEGPGEITFYAAQNLRRIFNVPVTIAGGPGIGIDGAVMNGEFSIDPNAHVWINNDRRLTLNNKSRNAGTLHLVTQNTHVYLDGSGWLDNVGLIEPYVGGSLFGGEAHIYLPINNAGAGKFVFLNNALVNFHTGGGLTNSGTFELRAGSRVAFTHEDSGRDIVLREGSTNIGSGVFLLTRSNRLLIDGAVTFATPLDLRDTTSVVGDGPLTFTGAQTLRRVFTTPVIFAPDSQIAVDTAAFDILAVETNATVSVLNDRTLDIGNVLTNRGMIHLVTQNTHTYMTGAGRVENFGTIRVYQGGPLFSGEAHIYLPLHIATGGLLLLDDNGWMRLHAGSSLAVNGAIEFRPGSRLAASAENPAPQINVDEGASIGGPGVMLFSGSTRLNLNAPISFSTRLDMQDSSAVSGVGTLTLSGSQTLRRVYNAPLRIGSGSVITIDNASFNAPTTIEQDATLNVTNDRTLTVNAPLVNFGTINLPSQSTHSYLTGSASVENFGLVRVFTAGALFNGEAHIYIPINVAAGGSFMTDDNAFAAFRAGGELAISGLMETRVGSRILFHNDGPARRMIFKTGATTAGPGYIQFSGPNRLVAEADVTLSGPAYIYDSSSSEGPGTIRLTANQTLYGTWRSPITAASDVTLNIDNATWTSNVLIETNATININGERSLSVTGTVTNRGAINMPSQHNHSYLYGGGRVVNENLFNIFAGNLFGSQAHIYANIDNAAGGRFVAGESTITYFHAGSSLSSSGIVEVRSNASITFVNEFPGRDFTLLDGSELTGPGVSFIRGNNRLVVEGTALFSGGRIDMLDSSQIAGTGTLVIGTNATLRIDHPTTIAPDVEVAGNLTGTSANANLRFNGHLHLLETGQLNLPVITTAVSFENDGGALVGTVLVDTDVPVTEWIAAVNGNWLDAANWSAGIPDSTKRAVINVPGTYTVVVNGSASAFSLQLGANAGVQTLQINNDLSVFAEFTTQTNTTLELRAGNLYGTAALRFRGAFTWIGGNIVGPAPMTAESTATVQITGNAGRNFSRTFENFGSVLWSDGALFANGGVINNRAGARWEATSDRAFYDGVFNNEGVFVKSSGSATESTLFGNSANSNMRFNNAGAVNVEAGTLRIDNSGVHNGAFNISAGARLWINGGSLTFASSSQVEGDGSFALSAGEAVFRGSYEVAGSTALSGGTLSFANTAVDLPNLSITGGTLTGSASITATADMSWTGGAVTGSGTLTIPATVTLNITTGTDKTLVRALNNLGTIAFPEGRLLANGGVVNNRAGAVWYANGNTFFYDGVFNNEGAVIRSVSPENGVAYFGNASTSNHRFNNAGLVDLQVGTIRIENTGVHSGIFEVDTNATLAITGGSHTFSAASTITGPGTVAINASVFVAGAYTVTGATALAGGTLSFDNTATSLPNYTQTGGTLTGAAEITLTTDASWSAGSIAGSGSVIIPSGVTLLISSATDHYLTRVVENFGTILWNAGRILANGGTVNNRAGGRLTLNGDRPFYDGVVNNEGLVSKTAGAADDSSYFGNAFTSAHRFNNTGTVNIHAGVLRIDNSGVHAGVFQISTNAVLSLTGGSHSFNTNSHIIGEGKFDVNSASVVVLGEYAVTGGTSLRLGALDFSNGTNELASFSMANGTLTSSFDLILTNAASWQAGTITGEGRFIVATSVEFTISSAADHYLSRVFVNRGTVRWTGGRILANGAAVENEPGGLWSIDTDGYFYDGVFNNAGTVIKTASPRNDPTIFGNAFSSNLRFNNSGLVRLDVGSLRLDNSGSHTGAFDLKTNTVLILNGGAHPFGPGSSVGGDGELTLNTGTLSAEGESLSLPKFVMNNGTLTGPAQITLSASSTWTAGTITGTGVLTVPAGATFTITSGNDRNLSRVLDNFGSIRWQNGRILANGGVVNIKSGAIWDIACDRYFFDGVVNNEGVIQKTAGAEDTYFENNVNSDLRFNNAGIVNVQAGLIRIRNSGAHAGLFQVALGSDLVFETRGDHTFVPGSAIAGPGDVHIRVPITLETDLSFGNATVVFSASASVSGAFNMSNEPGGSIRFAKSMNIPGSITVAGSIVTTADTISVSLAGDLLLLAGSVVDNPGLIQAANVEDQGATITGNPPVETPIAPMLRIDGLLVDGASNTGGKIKTALAAPTIALHFSATSVTRIVVETSNDLVHWTAVPSQVAPIAPGKFEARVPIADQPIRWFRLRQVP